MRGIFQRQGIPRCGSGFDIPMNNLIVIKVGSNIIIDDKGTVRTGVIEHILKSIKTKVDSGVKILLVTSGAVALGKKYFVGNELNKKLAAGIGQMELMSIYYETAKKLNLTVLELLLSRPHLIQRQHFLNLQKLLNDAFASGIIPIINENDILVYGTNWGFIDNDSLASSLAIALNADKLLILSHVDGLFTGDPKNDPNAKLVDEVRDVNKELMKLCSNEISDNSRGGMVNKLKVIRLCTAVGINAQIISGLKIDLLDLALAGEKVGTIFVARELHESVKNRARWILAARTSAGSIMVDDGAVLALNKGKSLLAVGIQKIVGSFAFGELVEIVNLQLETIAIGVADIDSDILQKIDFKIQKGVQVMHADNIMAIS